VQEARSPWIYIHARALPRVDVYFLDPSLRLTLMEYICSLKADRSANYDDQCPPVHVQVVRLTAVLANGTIVEFSNQKHPGLFKAFKTSVGRLGVVTTVTFKIVRNVPVHRFLRTKNLAVSLNVGRDGFFICEQALWCNVHIQVGRSRVLNHVSTPLPTQIKSCAGFWVVDPGPHRRRQWRRRVRQRDGRGADAVPAAVLLAAR